MSRKTLAEVNVIINKLKETEGALRSLAGIEAFRVSAEKALTEAGWTADEYLEALAQPTSRAEQLRPYLEPSTRND